MNKTTYIHIVCNRILKNKSNEKKTFDNVHDYAWLYAQIVQYALLTNIVIC